MTRRAQWALVTALVVAGAAGLWVASALGAGERRVGIGSSAPDFRATTLDDSASVRTIADYRGQVVLINLWATWCGPCVVEMPGIQRLYERFGPAGLRVVGIAVDDPGFEDRIREFVAEHHLTFEILHEGSGRIENDYQAQGIPSTYVIARDGRIRKLHLGATDWDSPANRALIAQLLGVAPGDSSSAIAARRP
jgi:cytochrome c biogenesis protein CcmG, thiol:disulfide interchange protein DsbE